MGIRLVLGLHWVLYALSSFFIAALAKRIFGGRNRIPKPVRRLLWWLGLNVFARQRARFMGTFGVTSTGAFGAGVLQVLSPLTCTVHYSLFDAAGNIDVRLTFDHRVFDGRTAAHGLAELEGVLGQEILQELRSLSAAQAA